MAREARRQGRFLNGAARGGRDSHTARRQDGDVARLTTVTDQVSVVTKKKTARAGTRKSSRKESAKAAVPARPVDPREPIEPTAANLEATVAALEAVVAKLSPPAEPTSGDLVDVMLHSMFGHELPCGVAQEAVRRIDGEFVDRNEYRVTEAFEVEDLLADLGLPDLFDRCQSAQQAIAQVYNDQNGVDLQYLREATVSERKNFFQRVPAIPTHTMRYLSHFLSLEEVAFSPRSTQRVQQRLGLDPKAGEVERFVERVRVILAPFGHLPIHVGPDPADGKPILEPVLCPSCLLVRLGPPGKG